MNMPMDDRLVAIRNAVEYVYGARVEGDIIEFGVMSGYSASALINSVMEFCSVYKDASETKCVWLCDSFQGFPEASNVIDANAPMIRSHIWSAGKSRGCSAEILRDSLRAYLPPDRLQIIAGWFKDSAEGFAAQGRRYALVHADCDLYQSTVDALDPVFRNGCISPGCMILFDDWNANHAAREFGQRAAWKMLTRVFNIDASDEGGYGVYSHRFIVHDYDAIDQMRPL